VPRSSAHAEDSSPSEKSVIQKNVFLYDGFLDEDFVADLPGMFNHHYCIGTCREDPGRT
jgi:hypothetical protein